MTLKRLIGWIKRVWYASPFHRHAWWYQVIDGGGFNLKTGALVEFHDEFEVCVVCRKRRPAP